jgi:hypothetical protein
MLNSNEFDAQRSEKLEVPLNVQKRKNARTSLKLAQNQQNIKPSTQRALEILQIISHTTNELSS